MGNKKMAQAFEGKLAIGNGATITFLTADGSIVTVAAYVTGQLVGAGILNSNTNTVTLVSQGSPGSGIPSVVIGFQAVNQVTTLTYTLSWASEGGGSNQVSGTLVSWPTP
jgi:hypothetical protein